MNETQFISAQHFLLSPCGSKVCGYFVCGNAVLIVTVITDDYPQNSHQAACVLFMKQTARGHWVDRADPEVRDPFGALSVKQWIVIHQGAHRNGDRVNAKLDYACQIAQTYVHSYSHQKPNQNPYSNYAMEA